MSDDRELLELAAKAAGHEVCWDRACKCYLYIHPEPDSKGFRRIVWMPNRDDGDAFRLAGALDMSVEFSEKHGCCEASCEHFSFNEHYINYGGDRMAAARMAILIAAAERGKAMP